MDVVNSAFPSCISGTLDGGKVSLSCKSTYCQGDQRLRRLHLPAFSNRPLCVASVQGPFLLQSRTVASYPPHGRGGRPATRPRFRGYGRRSPWSDFPIQVAERPYVAAPSASPTRGDSSARSGAQGADVWHGTCRTPKPWQRFLSQQLRFASRVRRALGDWQLKDDDYHLRTK
jgi:hypothetical protein